ncbi:helix-turn-helix domain-containing protein [Flavisphingomonas formosensis]|uniref:helix-turn-helix domain-containing protein n=1 Tax=Flavisphingomonas formosensis TaxID=861534 RepID=UPI0012F8A086|nr:AraC family transcriptional regulator [Sphingomonas formosensis]
MGLLETVTCVDTPSCRFELAQAEWPKPVELAWTAPQPVLSMMFMPRSYRQEGRFAGSRGSGYAEIGRTFILPPDRELLGRGTGGRIKAARCIFDRRLYQELLSPAEEFTDAELCRALDVGNVAIGALMRRLIQEAQHPGFGGQIVIDSIASLLLVECARQIFRAIPSDLANDRHVMEPRHLRMIEEYLDAVEAGMPQPADLARLCGYSTHYFAKLFRQTTGQSLGRYLIEWRLLRAQQLLAEGDLPLKEIAWRLGFSSAANFSTAFRHETGQTPGRFRFLRRSESGSGAAGRLH